MYDIKCQCGRMFKCEYPLEDGNEIQCSICEQKHYEYCMRKEQENVNGKKNGRQYAH